MEKKKKNHGVYRTLTLLGVIAAFLTFILAGITFIIQSGVKKINVEAQILSSEMLTMLASEAELSAHFRYSGELLKACITKNNKNTELNKKKLKRK